VKIGHVQQQHFSTHGGPVLRHPLYTGWAPKCTFSSHPIDEIGRDKEARLRQTDRERRSVSVEILSTAAYIYIHIYIAPKT